MDLLAAIDLRGGRAVRLLQGRYEDETSYGDPLALAELFAAQGADWLHLVDLDAARNGGQANRDIIALIASQCRIPVEAGGGVRTVADVAQLVEVGVTRVIVGTTALADPDELIRMCQAFPGRVAVGLDYRMVENSMREVAVRGWLEGAGIDLQEAILLVEQTNICAIISTAIDRDGTLQGPDYEGLHIANAAASVPVIASGGVGSLAHLGALKADGCCGVVVGKALVEGAFTVQEAMDVCK